MLTSLLVSATEKGPDPELVTPGVGGFLVIFVLALATIVLVRSMTKHLRNVRYSPDPAAEPEQRSEPDTGPDAGPDERPAGAGHVDQAEDRRT